MEKAGNSVDFLLVNVYNDLFLFTNVAYIENELHFFYKKKEYALDNNGKYTLSVKKDLIVKTLLLKYLVDNRYIYLVDQANVQGRHNDIHFNNEKDAQYEVVVDLPQDIVEFLNNSKRIVIVSEELKALVQNDFVTPEERLLKVGYRQIERLERQANLLEEQRLDTIKLVEAAEGQTREAKKQTQFAFEQSKEATEQSREASIQSEEAKKQTKLAQDQTEEAYKQRLEAQEQTRQALIQTEEAKKQTDLAQKQMDEAKEQTKEAKKQTTEVQKQTKYSLIVLAFAVVSLLCAIATVWIAHRQRKDALDCNGKNAERQEVIDSVQTKIIQSVNSNTANIKNNTDTLILNQREMNMNIQRINRKINKSTTN